MQARDPLWLSNTRQTSSEVQIRGISGPTEKTYVLKVILKNSFDVYSQHKFSRTLDNTRVNNFLKSTVHVNFFHNAAGGGVCPDPGNVPNAGRVTNGNTFLVGSTVTYRCRDGTILRGTSVLTCQSDGTWDAETPSCTCLGKFFDIRFSIYHFVHEDNISSLFDCSSGSGTPVRLVASRSPSKTLTVPLHQTGGIALNKIGCSTGGMLLAVTFLLRLLYYRPRT